MPTPLSATRVIERDRSALFSAMLLALTNVPADAGTHGFLNALCEGILSKNSHLHWAWYAFPRIGKPLRPAQEFGLQFSPTIPEDAQDPCYLALNTGTSIIYALNQTDSPTWLKSLRGQLAEIMIVPFGIEGQKALGVVGSSETGYFEQIGTEYFSAFAYMGDMIMSLQRQSRRDPLTGLFNRLELDERLEQALHHADYEQRLVAVAVMDIDNFKEINEQFGRMAGDQILVEFSQRLHKGLRSGDALFRLGGDEFVLLIENLERWADLEWIMERIRVSLDRAFVLDDTELRIEVSIGITVYPLDDSKARDIVHHADLALHQAKQQKNKHTQFYLLYDPTSIYDPNTPQQIAKREHFRLLLRTHVITLFQPILHTPSGRVQEVEALARLEDNGVLLGTAEFLPWLAPEDLRKLSCAVLEQAARQWRLWQDMGHTLTIGVNFEPQDLLLDEVIQIIKAVLERYQMPPHCLMIEVLEGNEFLDYASAKLQLARLKALGVRIALDDLGTAYASLLRLKDYPFDAVKLDQAFSRKLEQRPRDLHFLSSMLEIAHGLGVELIVEGVETSEVLAAVTALGIRQIQGYAISPPVSADIINHQFLGSNLLQPDSQNSLLVTYARFLILAKGLRTVLATMPRSLNVSLACDNISCPLYPVLESISTIKEQRNALQRVIVDIANGNLTHEYSLELYDQITAAILSDLATYITTSH